MVQNTDVRLILVTCGSMKEAENIASELVTEHLAACVNLVPAIQSLYWWEGVVQKDEEVLLLIKSTTENLKALQDRVISLHSYDTPEFIALDVSEGAEKYLDWLRSSVVLEK